MFERKAGASRCRLKGRRYLLLEKSQRREIRTCEPAQLAKSGALVAGRLAEEDDEAGEQRTENKEQSQ